MCPHPFIRTTVIRFVPRYYLVNRMDIPLVVKEKNFMRQKLLMNGDSVGFNLIGEEPYLLVRVVNCYEEFRAKP